jgi:hypothetical protein
MRILNIVSSWILVNLVMAHASSAISWSHIRNMPEAHIAPVLIAKGVLVSNPHSHDVLHLDAWRRGLTEDNCVNRVLPLHENCFNEIRNLCLKITFTSHLSKPPIRLFQSIRSVKYPAFFSYVKCWRFAKVVVPNMSSQPFLQKVWRTCLAQNRIINFSGENIWSLISLKEFLCSVKVVAAKAHQPCSQTCIDNDCYQCETVYKPRLIVVGVILFLLGPVLIYQVFCKLDIYFSRNSSIAVPFALIMLSAILMWLGMWLVGSGFEVFT